MRWIVALLVAIAIAVGAGLIANRAGWGFGSFAFFSGWLACTMYLAIGQAGAR